MIWALLAVWLLGSGGSTPLLSEIQRIEKKVPRRDSIKALIKDLKGMDKARSEKNERFVKNAFPLLEPRVIDKDIIASLIGERQMTAEAEELAILDKYLQIRAQMTKEEWDRLSSH